MPCTGEISSISFEIVEGQNVLGCISLSFAQLAKRGLLFTYDFNDLTDNAVDEVICLPNESDSLIWELKAASSLQMMEILIHWHSSSELEEKFPSTSNLSYDL